MATGELLHRGRERLYVHQRILSVLLIIQAQPPAAAMAAALGIFRDVRTHRRIDGSAPGGHIRHPLSADPVVPCHDETLLVHDGLCVPVPAPAHCGACGEKDDQAADADGAGPVAGGVLPCKERAACQPGDGQSGI